MAILPLDGAQKINNHKVNRNDSEVSPLIQGCILFDTILYYTFFFKKHVRPGQTHVS